MFKKILSMADKVLLKVEKKSFDAANKAHKLAINGILLFLGYGLYGCLRDYNLFFLSLRVNHIHIYISILILYPSTSTSTSTSTTHYYYPYSYISNLLLMDHSTLNNYQMWRRMMIDLIIL